MAHAAEIGDDGVVIRVIVIPDDVVDEQAFCAETLALGGTWKRTHKGTRGASNPRKNYAGPGYSFDAARDAFVPPRPTDIDGKPYLSWIVDDDTALWKAPKARPADGKDYDWDETAGDWVEVRRA